MKKIILIALTISLAAPLYAGDIENLVANADKQFIETISPESLSLKNEFSKENNNNIALAALYNRLFQLQDKKREIELKKYKETKVLKSICAKFRKDLGNYSNYNDDELLEIANDPEHPNYPGLLETAARKGMKEIRLAGEEIEYSDFTLKRIDDDIKKTEIMISEFLNSQNNSKN